MYTFKYYQTSIIFISFILNTASFQFIVNITLESYSPYLSMRSVLSCEPWGRVINSIPDVTPRPRSVSPVPFSNSKSMWVKWAANTLVRKNNYLQIGLHNVIQLSELSYIVLTSLVSIFQTLYGYSLKNSTTKEPPLCFVTKKFPSHWFPFSPSSFAVSMLHHPLPIIQEVFYIFFYYFDHWHFFLHLSYFTAFLFTLSTTVPHCHISLTCFLFFQ